jgi:hypothetical protein
MESIYYVLSWLCHRRCRHCYEDRFHPYYGEELDAVVAEARTNFPRVIANFPARMTYLDPAERRGRIILAGGEMLLDPVRESVLYPALDLLHAKYKDTGGVDLIVQTTGDILRPEFVHELLAHHVTKISVSGIDSFHDGLQTIGAQQALVAKLTAMVQEAGLAPEQYGFFGAQHRFFTGFLSPQGGFIGCFLKFIDSLEGGLIGVFGLAGGSFSR